MLGLMRAIPSTGLTVMRAVCDIFLQMLGVLLKIVLRNRNDDYEAAFPKQVYMRLLFYDYNRVEVFL